MPDQSVHCVVTSPPYWGLRDYGTVGQLGLESTPEEYVANMVAVFREVRRVLREDGTLWLNLGDSYAANRGYQHTDVGNSKGSTVPLGLKPKDLVGIPCGKPWERVVERTPMVVEPSPTREARTDGGRLRTQTNGTMVQAPSSVTTGWAPTCDHNAPTVPAVVLDPFAGAGTTGMVALRLGRSFIGIEAQRQVCRDGP